jgi:hypothetical protein
MPSNRQMAEHLFSCFDAIYLVLGEGAPRFSNDAYVIRAHEMSRAFGGLALEARTYLGSTDATPLPVLEGVLHHAVDSDDSGAMAMFAMAMAIGPRLLVSLLDARDAMGDDDGLRALLDHGSRVCVTEIRAVGEIAKDQPPVVDPSWQMAARDLVSTLDSAGNAESLGLSR